MRGLATHNTSSRGVYQRRVFGSWLGGLFGNSTKTSSATSPLASSTVNHNTATNASHHIPSADVDGNGGVMRHNKKKDAPPTQNEIALHDIRSHLSEIRKNPTTHPHAFGPKRLEQEIALVVMLCMSEGEAERLEALGRGEGLWRVFVGSSSPSDEDASRAAAEGPAAMLKDYGSAMESVCRKWSHTVPASQAASHLRMVLSAPLSLAASSLSMHALATRWEGRRSGAGEAPDSAGLIHPRAFDGESLPMRDVIMGGFGGQVMSNHKGGANTSLTSCTGQLRELEKANAAKKAIAGAVGGAAAGGADSPFRWSRDGGGASRSNNTNKQPSKPQPTELEKRFPTEAPITSGGQFGGGYGLDEDDEAFDEMDSYLRDKLKKDGINAAALEAERMAFEEDDHSGPSAGRGGSSPFTASPSQSDKDKEAADKYANLFGKQGSLAGGPPGSDGTGGKSNASPMDQWRAEVVNEHPFLHMRSRNKTDSGPRWS